MDSKQLSKEEYLQLMAKERIESFADGHYRCAGMSFKVPAPSHSHSITSIPIPTHSHVITSIPIPCTHSHVITSFPFPFFPKICFSIPTHSHSHVNYRKY